MGHRRNGFASITFACIQLAYLCTGALASDALPDTATIEINTLQHDVLECAAFQNIMAQALASPPNLAGWEQAVAKAQARRDQLIQMGSALAALLDQQTVAVSTSYELANQTLASEVKLNGSNYSLLLSRYAPACSVIAEEAAPKIEGWLAASRVIAESEGAASIE
jgi:hypothetical protein